MHKGDGYSPFATEARVSGFIGHPREPQVSETLNTSLRSKDLVQEPMVAEAPEDEGYEEDVEESKLEAIPITSSDLLQSHQGKLELLYGHLD